MHDVMFLDYKCFGNIFIAIICSTWIAFTILCRIGNLGERGADSLKLRGEGSSK